MENDPEMDYPTLEPDVIIDDESGSTLFNQSLETSKILNRIGPDVSLIPVRKLRSFDKIHYDETGMQRKQNVRLISKEEVVDKVRNSLPLQKCNICKKYFRRMKTHLQKHEAIQRNPSDRLTCKLCMKGFNTGSNLSIHMRTHTGDKPYVCEICTKGFAQSCNLVNHMRIHTGERPYRCPHCDRAFTQSGNLSNHIRLHTDEKPFKCHFCDKAFTQSGNLNSHIRNNHKFTDEITSLLSA